MNRRDAASLLVIAFCITLAATAIIFTATAGGATDQERLEYIFFVEEQPGFDVGTDVLRLGAATPGGRTWRTVTVQHAEADTVEVRVTGEGVGILRVDEVRKEIVDGEATFTFAAEPPEDARPGEYRGEIVFVFR